MREQRLEVRLLQHRRRAHEAVRRALAAHLTFRGKMEPHAAAGSAAGDTVEGVTYLAAHDGSAALSICELQVAEMQQKV